VAELETSSLPGPNRPRSSSARLTICERSRQSLRPRRPPTQLHIRPFCAVLVRRWQQPPWKVDCSVLAVRA
jgi:hypothetical protein